MIVDVWHWFTDPANWSGENGITNRLVEHTLLTLTATVVVIAVGLPLALWLGHIGRGGALAINLSNAGRAVPTFAVLLLLSLGPLGTDQLGPYGRAGLATLVALVLFGLPPVVTNAYTAVREVEPETVEAARGMGMTGLQLLLRVELPLAVPLVLAGIRLAVVQIWATATIAALVAGPGLGRIITLGFVRQDITEVVAGSLLVALIALVLDLAFALLQRRLDPAARAARGGVVLGAGATVETLAEPGA